MLLPVSSSKQSQFPALISEASEAETTQEPSQAKSDHIPFQLTVREIAVVVLLFTLPGITRKHVAQKLNLPIGTLNSRIESIYQKLGADNRFEALQKLSKSGFEAQRFTWTLPSQTQTSNSQKQNEQELEPISA